MFKKFGLLFPGQGAQAVGMGKELYETEPAARIVYDKASEVLGRDLSSLCFQGPEDELMATANSQPAIFVTSIATLNVLVHYMKKENSGNESGATEIFTPEDITAFGSLAMGLSLGEPTALVASGALGFEDGLRFVERRGYLMDEASKRTDGKMASIIGLALDKIEEICCGIGCQVANLNCPGQVVISGHAGKVELAMDLAKNAGAKRAIPLKVSGAFHSELMTPAKEKLGVFLADMDIREPSVDFISNVDACITRDPEKIRQNLADQLDSRTLWQASMEKAVASGTADYLEIGPGTVLSGLARKIDGSVRVVSLHSSDDIKVLVQD